MYEENFISEENVEQFEQECQQAIKLANQFKLDKLTKPLVNYKDQEIIKKQIFQKFPQNSTEIPELLKEYQDKILEGSVNWSSPYFLAFPDSNNAKASTIGHILQGMTSQNLCNSLHISPTATIVEIQIIKWLREALGFKVKKDVKSVFEIGGIYSPGGVLSNTIGLLLAREKKFKQTMKKGVTFDPKKVKIFMPESVGHYSSKCAAAWLGLGLDSIKLVKTGKNFCFDLAALENELQKCKKAKQIPLAVVAYAGDSRTMSIDNFPKIAELCEKYDTWFHVDACHGSALSFSKKYKHLIKGIELADSVTLDPHKIFWMPYNLSYILVKNPEDLKLISGSSDLITNESLSMGQISPFIGSWGFHSLKLWFLFKNLGKKKLQTLIDDRTDKAIALSKKIKKVKDFYIFNDITINSVTFMYIPYEYRQRVKDGDITAINKVNKLNKNIREELFHNNSIFIHTFPLKDYKGVMCKTPNHELQMLRIMISNPLFNRNTENMFMNKIQTVAKEQLRKI